MLPCSAFTPYAVLLATTLVLVRREEPDSEAVCHSFAVQSNTAHMAVEHEPIHEQAGVEWTARSLVSATTQPAKTTSGSGDLSD
jgi:hypothetical protein